VQKVQPRYGCWRRDRCQWCTKVCIVYDDNIPWHFAVTVQHMCFGGFTQATGVPGSKRFHTLHQGDCNLRNGSPPRQGTLNLTAYRPSTCDSQISCHIENLQMCCKVLQFKQGFHWRPHSTETSPSLCSPSVCKLHLLLSCMASDHPWLLGVLRSSQQLPDPLPPATLSNRSLRDHLRSQTSFAWEAALAPYPAAENVSARGRQRGPGPPAHINPLRRSLDMCSHPVVAPALWRCCGVPFPLCPLRQTPLLPLCGLRLCSPAWFVSAAKL
jgi:hypothetical protein